MIRALDRPAATLLAVEFLFAQTNL